MYDETKLQNKINALQLNSENFKEFDMRLQHEGKGLNRRVRCLDVLTLMNRVLKKDITELTQQDINFFLII